MKVLQHTHPRPQLEGVGVEGSSPGISPETSSPTDPSLLECSLSLRLYTEIEAESVVAANVSIIFI